jgi:hypothetical protein
VARVEQQVAMDFPGMVEYGNKILRPLTHAARGASMKV